MNSSPSFLVPVQALEVPPELASMPGDAIVRMTESVAGRRMEGTCTARDLVELIHEKVMRQSEDEPAPPTSAARVLGVETPLARRSRRLARLQELGADMKRAGTSWHTCGERGALATLVREEQQASSPMSDKTDVRADLRAAMGD